MGFESPQTPKEIHELQPALPKVMETILDKFETNVRVVENPTDRGNNPEYKPPMAERYLGMSMNQLFNLQIVVGDLRAALHRLIKTKDFILNESQRDAIKEAIKATNEVILSDEETEFFKPTTGEVTTDIAIAGDEETEEEKRKVDETLANSLGNRMHALNESIEELKKTFQPK